MTSSPAARPTFVVVDDEQLIGTYPDSMNLTPAGPVPGRLVIRGVRCSTEGAQLLVDITAHTDLGPAARSGEMADAVDIAEIVEVVRAAVTRSPSQLLETLAVRCAQALLERFAAIDEIEVRMTKPDPPGLDAEAEVVEVRLAR